MDVGLFFLGLAFFLFGIFRNSNAWIGKTTTQLEYLALAGISFLGSIAAKNLGL